MMKKEKSAYVIQTVGHALDVLEQFYVDGDEIGLTELCKRLKLYKNKMYRLLATLESRNFIEQNKVTANYRLGLKSLQLGQTFIKQTRLLSQAKPVLESLVSECKETSSVVILKDFQTVCLDAVESHLPVRVVPRVGAMHPFYCTGAGKVLAASMNEKSLAKLFRSGELQRYTSNTIIDPDELMNHLHSIEEQGYAVGDEEFEVGVKCIGVPVRDYTKLVIGAVSISGPAGRLTTERIHKELLPHVKDAAAELSAQLGYS